MKILVACEESQEVCKAFRAKGHEAFSCDIQECSGGYPQWHLQCDVTRTLDDGWDMIIAFPPCTHLAVSGARHFEKKRQDGRQKEGIEFFMKIMNAKCNKIAIENPVGIISGDYIPKWFPELAEQYELPIKPTQIIQPYMFGHPCKKTTCLWLKNLPKLVPTHIVEPELVSYICKSGKKVTFSKHMITGFKADERTKVRSKTFPGVAQAMAEQWG